MYDFWNKALPQALVMLKKWQKTQLTPACVALASLWGMEVTGQWLLPSSRTLQHCEATVKEGNMVLAVCTRSHGWF